MKEEVRKQLEGRISTDTDAEVTPITRTPITTIEADKWMEMSITELHDQLAVLEKRRIQLHEIGHGHLAPQIERGIAHLQAILAKRTSDLPRLL